MKIPDTKICKDCGDEFPRLVFQHHKSKNGKKYAGAYCPKCKTTRNLRHRYGLCFEDYIKLLEDFPVCAICGGTDRLCIDHSHSTGRIRGRLCLGCNTAIGMFQENAALLDSAKRYLTSYCTSGTVKA